MNRLKEFRQQAGLSQYQLAKKLNWWQSRIGNYEVGVRIPSIAAARAIVNVLNDEGVECSLDEVFPGSISNQ